MEKPISSFLDVEIMSKGIIHIKANTQYDLCVAFLRLQEFYESPFPEIYRKVFSLETYMDRYAEANGNFTYTQDWDGFNVPCSIIKEFKKVYKNKLSAREKSLFKLIAWATKKFDRDEKYYVIGTIKGTNDVLNHELCHALYYLKSMFRVKSNVLLFTLPDDCKAAVTEFLKNRGYHQEVFRDEMNAYLATSSMTEIKEIMDETKLKKIPWTKICSIQSNFEEFYGELN